MATKIDSVTARDKLKPRREPYWHRITKGCFLGYRKMTAGTGGAWVVRTLDQDTGGQKYRSLGGFPELPDHQRFDAAQRACQEWLKHLDKGGITQAKTIRDACDNYVEHIKETRSIKASEDAEKRFKNYVTDQTKFADLELSKLKTEHLDEWLKALRTRPTRSGGNRGEKRSSSTLNRDITPFRAALNLAFKAGWITSDFTWRSKLTPLKNADKKRELYLDRKQRIKFIDGAAPDVGLFLRGMALLPVRPGALARLTVTDFDSRLKVLRITQDKTGARTIQLPIATADLFKLASKDKLPAAPLFARADGLAWNKDSWKGPVKDAAIAAKMPTGTTAYTLRHSVITDLVHGGLDLLTVAQISGTSVRMIEKNYGHLRGTVAAKALASLAL